MKKLLFVLMTVFTITLTSCANQDNTVTRYNTGENPSVPTPENAEQTETAAAPTETPTPTPSPSTEDKINATPTSENKEERKNVETASPGAENNEANQDSINPPTKKPTPQTQTPKSGDLTVTNFEGGKLETKMAYNLVKGSTPKNTHSLWINGYKLQKYYPGQTAWSYIASTQYKTLKNGLNTYEVKALDKSGKEIDRLTFSIDYQEINSQELPHVGAGLTIAVLLFSVFLAGFVTLRKNRSNI